MRTSVENWILELVLFCFCFFHWSSKQTVYVWLDFTSLGNVTVFLVKVYKESKDWIRNQDDPTTAQILLVFSLNLLFCFVFFKFLIFKQNEGQMMFPTLQLAKLLKINICFGDVDKISLRDKTLQWCKKTNWGVHFTIKYVTSGHGLRTWRRPAEEAEMAVCLKTA